MELEKAKDVFKAHFAKAAVHHDGLAEDCPGTAVAKKLRRKRACQFCLTISSIPNSKL
jgi:hypothetical protein